MARENKLPLDAVVLGNIGVDTNVYLSAGSSGAESTFTTNLDVIGQAGGYSSFGFSSLGLRTGFIGSVGDDPFGRWIRAELADAGVEGLLFTDPAGTNRSINLIAPDGTRRNFYDGKSHLTLSPDLEACRGFLAGARHLHSHLPNWARRVLPLAHSAGLAISSDLQDLVQIDDPYRRDFIDASSIVFCSGVNLSPETIGAALVARKPSLIVVFGMGARGAGLYTSAGFRHFPPVEMELPVVDTNGAGDSLAVGFLTAYLFEKRSLEEAISWGQVAARWCCTLRAKWRGLIRREQLLEFLG